MKNQEDTKEEKVDERSTIQYWLRWIKSAKENTKAKRHKHETKSAWSEYEKEASSADEGREDSSRSYPIYHVATETLRPAYRARTPKLCSDRRFGLDDVTALTGSVIIERLGEHCIDSCNYDETITKCVLEFIHGGKATVQLVYEAEINKSTSRVSLVQAEDGSYLTPEGPYQGEVLLDEQGYFYNAEIEEVGKQFIGLVPGVYDEVIHTPDAKNTFELEDVGYYFSLSKEEAITRFPSIEGKAIAWKRKGNEEDDDSSYSKTSIDMPGEYLDGYEIWCKHTKNVYWVSPSCYPHDFLDVKQDPYELRNFFPSTPFIIGSPSCKHLYPTPMFVHLAPTIEQLHACYRKVFKLIRSIRRRALIDGSTPEVLSAFEELGDQEFITVQNLNALVDKGGIQNLIWYIPVQELVQAITELNAIDQQFRNNFNEWFGVPDILRGTADPLTTATAEQIAANAAHDRFRYNKALIHKMERNAIEMMVDLALKVYSDEKIARIAGYQYMDPEEQQAFPAALALLRNDEERLIRIDIETDSTSFVNEIQDNQHRTQVVQALIGGMKEITGMLQVDPQYAAISLHATMHVLDGLKGGKQFIEELKGYTQQLIDKAMNPPPPPPPPPDYEAMKLQIAQLGQQNKTFELQIKQQESQASLQKDNFELMLKQQAEQFQQWLQSNYFKLEEQKAELERYQVVLNEREKYIEEQRLAQEQMLEAMKPQELPQPAQPPVQPQLLQITVGEQKAKRRRIIPLRDEMGEIVGADVEEMPVI